MTQNDLPKNWHTMPVDRLWDALNGPKRFSTPQSAIDALMFCIKERGTAALEEPDNVERLSRCDQAARAQVDKRIDALRQKGLLK
jgi:hypothetical protein